MSFETVENVLNINVDATLTLAMAAILLLIGYFVKKKVHDRFGILYSGSCHRRLPVHVCHLCGPYDRKLYL